MKDSLKNIIYSGPRTAIYTSHKKRGDGTHESVPTEIALEREWRDFAQAYVENLTSKSQPGTNESQWVKPGKEIKGQRIKAANMLNDIVFGESGVRGFLKREGIDPEQAIPEQEAQLRQIREQLADICLFNSKRTGNSDHRPINRLITNKILSQWLKLGEGIGTPPPGDIISLKHLTDEERKTLLGRPEAQLIKDMVYSLNYHAPHAAIFKAKNRPGHKHTVDEATIDSAMDRAFNKVIWSYDKTKPGSFSHFFTFATVRYANDLLARAGAKRERSNRFAASGTRDDGRPFGVDTYTPDRKTPGIDAAPMREDFLRWLQERIGELPEIHQEALSLWLRGYIQKEIGAELGGKKTLGGKVIAQAISALRKKLSPEDAEILDRNMQRRYSDPGEREDPAPPPARPRKAAAIRGKSGLPPAATEVRPNTSAGTSPATENPLGPPLEMKGDPLQAPLGGAIAIFRSRKTLTQEALGSWIKGNQSPYMPCTGEEAQQLNTAPGQLIEAVESGRHTPSEGLMFNIARALERLGCINDAEKNGLFIKHRRLLGQETLARAT